MAAAGSIMDNILTAWLSVIAALGVAGLAGILRVWWKLAVMETRVTVLEKHVEFTTFLTQYRIDQKAIQSNLDAILAEVRRNKEEMREDRKK
jgi:hypothetical protein